MNDVVLGYALMLVREKFRQDKRQDKQHAIAPTPLDATVPCLQTRTKSARRDSLTAGAID